MFEELLKSLNFSFLLSFCHINFAHYLPKNFYHDLIIESIKALEIKTSSNTILSTFFFLIIDLYFSILAAFAPIFHPTAELITLIAIPSKEVKAEIEIHPVTIEAKMRKCSM